VRVKEATAGGRQGVEDDFARATRVRQASLAENPEVVPDKILGTHRDPRQITDAQLLAVRKGECDHDACLITQRPRHARRRRRRRIEALADLLGLREIQAQQVIPIIRHRLILSVGMMMH
jgi:hypothetical protein